MIGKNDFTRIRVRDTWPLWIIGVVVAAVGLTDGAGWGALLAGGAWPAVAVMVVGMNSLGVPMTSWQWRQVNGSEPR